MRSRFWSLWYTDARMMEVREGELGFLFGGHGGFGAVIYELDSTRWKMSK